MVGTIGHLARRLIESVRASSVDQIDLEWVRETLSAEEFALWSKMQVMDRVHSIGVARRLISGSLGVEKFEVVAALLHDVGKLQSSLGVPARIAATILGPRNRKWREYLDHESIGASMCRDAGLDPRVCNLISGNGPREAQERLRRADDL
jgi:putative nucleotidyltransferase with HDIG domain